MKFTVSQILMVGVVFFGLANVAGTIKTWSSSEVLTASDLNSNFSHVHSAAEAAVSDSKLSTTIKQRLPKAWAHVSDYCGVGTCTLASSYGITSIVGAGPGQYTITPSTSLGTDAMAIVTPECGSSGDCASAANSAECRIDSISSTTVVVLCTVDSSTPANGVGLHVVLYDDD